MQVLRGMPQLPMGIASAQRLRRGSGRLQVSSSPFCSVRSFCLYAIFVRC